MNFKKELKNPICNNNIGFLETNKSMYSINDRFEDEGNDTILLYSVSDPHSEAYEYFLENGANTDLTNDDGEGILHAIIYANDMIRLMKIAKYQLNINHQANDSSTALLLAISLGRFDLAKSLIKLGADVNIANNDGITPLHLAVQQPVLAIVKILFDAGSNVFLKTKQGNLPLALAVNAEFHVVIRFVYDKVYKKNDFLSVN